MINRTIVDGVPASRLDDIRTADCVTTREGVGLRMDAQAQQQPSATAFARAAPLRADATCPDESARFSGSTRDCAAWDEPLVVGETRQPHFWWQIL